MPLILRRLLPLFILVIAGVGTFTLIGMKKPPEKKELVESLPVVQVMAIEKGPHQVAVRSYGVVEAKHKTQLVAEIRGRIIEISPKFVSGGWVRQGDLLAKIEPADYEADLMQSKAQLAQAKAQLQEEIARGEVAKREWQGVVEGIPPELGLRKPQLAQQQANVRSAEAALARAERNLERTEIRAPFDGMVTARSVDPGQYVNVSENLGQVQNTAIAEVRLPVSPDELEFIENLDGTPVVLTQTLAGKSMKWPAKLVRSEGIIADDRMVYLVAEVVDPYGRASATEAPLKFGSFVNAEITGRQYASLVYLPRHAVRNQRVTVIRPDNTVELRKVEVVRSDLESVYIGQGLKQGERISLNAMDAVDVGRKVKVLGETLPVETETEKESITTGAHVAAAGAR